MHTVTEMTFGNFQDDEYDDPPAKPAQPQQHAGRQSVVAMTLDDARLPVSVQLDKQWDRKVSPEEMSAQIFQGYVEALWKHDRDALEAGHFERLSSIPSRRTRLLTLLDARTLDEHRVLTDSLFGEDNFVGRSRWLDRWDEPVVTLTADRATVRSATASPEWIATAHAESIAAEILYCAEQLRACRLSVHIEGESDLLSDTELEERYADHLGELTRRAASE